MQTAFQQKTLCTFGQIPLQRKNIWGKVLTLEMWFSIHLYRYPYDSTLFSAIDQFSILFRFIIIKLNLDPLFYATNPGSS